MRKLIAYFVDRSFVVNLVSVFIVVAGTLSLTSMKRDLIPPLKFEQIQISASVPGATPPDMEKHVTFPIEEALKGIPGVKEMRSYTRQASSQITLEFQAGFDAMQAALEQVRSRVDAVKSLLPRSIRPITINQVAVDTVNFLDLVVRNVDQNDAVHRDWIRAAQERFRKIPGIVNVTSDLYPRNLYIDFRPEDLARHGISVSQARRRLQDFFSYSPIGEVRVNENRIAVEVEKKVTDIDDVRAIPVVGNRMGKGVHLKDIAEVNYRFADREWIRLINGEDAVKIDLHKDLLSDAITLKDGILDRIDVLNEEMPEPLTVELLGDGPYFIEKQLEVLRNNALLGLALVVTILMLFLGRGTALMAAWGVPIAYFGAFVVLDYLNISIDLISIVGMILILGVVVDDAIIVSERYVQYRQEGEGGREAAIRAARSLILPVTGTILTTIVAFSPILFVSSQLSIILFSIPVVIISALLLSWIECFFILPNHLHHFVGGGVGGPLKLDRLQGGYERLLRVFLRYRYLFLLGFVGLGALSGYVASEHLDKEFRFRIGSHRVNVYAVLKSSPSVAATREAIEPLHEKLAAIPRERVRHYRTDVGRVWMDGRVREGYRYSRVRIYIPEGVDDPEAVREGLEKELGDFLESMKDERFERLEVRTRMAGHDEAKEDMAAVLVRGGDRLSYDKVVAEIEGAVSGLPFYKGVSFDEDRVQEAWRFEADKEALLRYGIDAADLAEQLAESMAPQELERTRIRGEQVYVYTQINHPQALTFERLSGIEILSAKGLAVPARYLGKWQKTETLKAIRHADTMREFQVDVRYAPEKAEIDEVKDAVSAGLEPLRARYPSYDIRVEDADRQAAENREWARKIVLLCVSLIVFVLALVLGSVTQPLVVALAIPFGVIGIIWALFLHGLPLGVMAVIGVVGVAGVAVNDSLIMTDTINQLSRQGVGDAIVKGARSRLRAIVLTTVTTLGGVMPMAYGIGGDSGFTRPLAFSMGWGLAASTLLTLFLLPLLLAMREDLHAVWGWVASRTGIRRELTSD